MRTKRIFVVCASLVMCLLAIAVWPLWNLAQSPVGLFFRAESKGDTLSIANLAPSERVVIFYQTSGCFHFRECQYQIEGRPLQFDATPLQTSRTAGDQPPHPSVSGQITLAEAIGLDAYLAFLRHGVEGGSTTIDRIAVSYYRDGIQIGEERFVDGTGRLGSFRRDAGRVVALEDDAPENFPREMFLSIIPPWLVEARLNEHDAR